MADAGSHLPFALKYRPQTFDDVIGQPHVTTTLKNAITQKKIHHAYLFSGPRGVGKTSLARIFAKCLNCAEGPALKPCQTCPSCREITGGSSLDVLEIDGASNTGVDDVRALRENVRYLPAHGRYRIYIIDEVHMLSQAAFNALLKTLEEPPAHVIFLFATTESQKIPLTIISRCHRFEFRRIPLPALEAKLRNLAQREGLEIPDDALALIAGSSEGSLRDAESLFEQAAAFSGREVTAEKVQDLLGRAPAETVRQILEAIAVRDPGRCLKIIEDLYLEGRDLKQVADEILEILRSSLTDPHPLLEGLGERTVIRLFGAMYQEYSAIARSPEPRIGLEAALVKMSQLPLLESIEEVIGRLQSSSSPIKSPANTMPVKPVVPSPPPKPSGFDWNEWVAGLKMRRPQIGALVEHGSLLHTGDGFVEIGFPKGSIHLEMLRAADKAQALHDLIGEALGRKTEVRLTEREGVAGRPTPPSPLEMPEVKNAMEILGAKVREVRQP